LTYGLITSAIKLAIKLKNYCSYNKQQFVVATTKLVELVAAIIFEL